MMTPGSDVLQFVDAISASPTVLLDLNSGSPIYLARDGWSAPPPRLNRSASSSSARDGSVVSQSAYADRELVITLGLDTVSQDQAAEAIQALARLLNSDGQWLKYQCAIEPVFFRTKRAEIDALSEFNGQADGFREVTIRIPAEPFAYGLPVTGTATINNDPTAASGPMSYVLPAVQGDVATELILSLSNMDVGRGFVLSSCSGGSSTTGVSYMGASTAQIVGSDWTYTAASADKASTSIGGTADKFVGTTGGFRAEVRFDGITVPATGDYRLLVRVATSASFGSRMISLGGVARSTGNQSPPFAYHAITPSTSDWQWVDLGVVGAPDSSDFSGVPGLLNSSTSQATISIFIRNDGPGTATSYIDGIVLVPAGLQKAAQTSVLMGTRADSSNSSVIPGGLFHVDSLRQRLFVSDGSQVLPISAAGGFPKVLPGVRNVIALVKGVHLNAYSDNPSDDKSVPTTAAWMYYPRYLYIRPATT